MDNYNNNGYYSPRQNQRNQEQKDNNTKKIVAIILVMIIILLSCAIGFGIFLNKRKDADDEEALKKAVENYTTKQLLEFYYDDYDADGKSEAFAIAGDRNKDEFKKADIIYVDRKKKPETVDSDIDGHTNGKIHDGKVKFVSVEKEAENAEDNRSFVYGVKEKEAYQPEISGKYRNVRQENKSIVAEDPATGETLVLNVNKDGELAAGKADETTTHSTTGSTATTAATTATTTTTTAKKSAADNATIHAEYKNLLKDISNSPQKYLGDIYSGPVSDEEFGIADINNDGIDDLIVRVGSLPMAVMQCHVWSVDASTGETYKFEGYLACSATFYSTGYCDYGHNNAVIYALPPVSVLKIDGKRFETIFTIICREENDDFVYYKITPPNYDDEIRMNEEELEKLENQYTPDAAEIKINYKNITPSNINSIE